MTMNDPMTYLPIILRPDPSRTVVRPFTPEDPSAFALPGASRAQRIVDRVLKLGPDELIAESRLITNSLDGGATATSMPC